MKKFYALFIVSAIALTVNAQIALLDNFVALTPGNLGTQGNWSTTNGNPDAKIVLTNPLTYPGYTSGNEYVTVANVNGKNPYRTFGDIATGNTTVYMSFVVRVSSASDVITFPPYSLTLSNAALGSKPLRFYIAREFLGSQLQFGIATGASFNLPTYTSTTNSFTTNTTYLIVIRYTVTNGISNDDAYLWVNPVLSSEPTIATAGAVMEDAIEVGFDSKINTLGLHQIDNTAPNVAFDAFRIAYGATPAIAWTNLAPVGAPLPVVLTSFDAGQDGLNNKLTWQTAEESGVTHYVIEKSTDGRNFAAVGTVTAANQRVYTYTDLQAASAYNYYRLKIMEQDGSFRYSYIVSVKSALNMLLTLSPNPVKNILLVQHPKATAGTHLQVVNVGGKMIKDITLAANTAITTIDMSALSNGLYYVLFKSGKDVISKTVSKQ